MLKKYGLLGILSAISPISLAKVLLIIPEEIQSVSKLRYLTFTSFNINKQNATLQKIINDITPNYIHRIAILEGDAVVGILTQTKILEFLFQNNAFNEIGTLGSMSIGELRLGYRPVYKVSSQTKAIVAFQEMATYGVSCLAIVNNNGQLIGNLSASDIKEIGYNMNLYSNLFRTVEYLKQFQGGGKIQDPFVVTPTTTVTQILGFFVHTKVHRFFIIDKQGALLGIISPHDILKCFESIPFIPVS